MDEITDLLLRGKHMEARAQTYDHLMQEHAFATMKDTEEIYVYNGGNYEPYGDKIINTEFVEAWGPDANMKHCNEIKFRIRGNTYIDREDFNGEVEYVPVLNGLLNLRESRLEDFNPKRMFTFKLPINYNVMSQCPEIHAFFQRIFKPEDVELGYEIITYCLWRKYPIHKAFMLVGEGKNGKTTFLNLMKRFLGKENISTRELQELVHNNFAASDLYGKLANICDDLPSDKLFKTGKFKMLTGGGSLKYEKKHKDASHFENYAKMVFASNHIPQSMDTTYAFFRRWCIIEFPNTFSKESIDPDLEDKIYSDEELSGLLNACITRLGGLLKRGEFTVGSTDDAEREWMMRSDSSGVFFRECVSKDVSAGPITRGRLYSIYCMYCDKHNIDPVDQNVFTRQVRSSCPYAEPTQGLNDEGKRERSWRNIKIVCEDFTLTDTDNTENITNLYAREGV